MKFEKIITLRGPNLWARFPVLEAWVELGDLKDSPSDEMPGFNDRLMGWLPTMIEHRCSVGERGGFFERLRRGTYLAHILEHVTLELQSLAGYEFGFGRARESSREGLFRVAVRYEDEAVGRACLEVGRRLCLAAVHDQPFDVAAEVRSLRLLADDVRLGPSTATVVHAARAQGIPIRRLNDGSLVQLGHGALQRRIHRSATDSTSAVTEAISDDKDLTKAYLRSAGVPVAKGRLVVSAEDAWTAAQEIGTSVVVKPKDGNYGNGVVIGISKREQIEAAFHFAAKEGTAVMVEQLVLGAEHRLLVVGSNLVAATRGNPAFVMGDGRQTVAQLIDSQLNSDPRRGKDLSCPLSQIELDPTVLLVLEQEGYAVDSVPPSGKRVMIQRNGNLAIDVTDSVHPEVARMAVLAAQVVGLDVAGIDVIAHDIGRPLAEQGGVVIEVNAGPGLQMHVEPESGKPRPAGEAIVATMFGPGQTGRIPIVAIMGPERTTEITHAIGKILAASGRTVGLASARGTSVGEMQTDPADGRHADSVRGLLLNNAVQCVACEVSVEGLLTEGLGFDLCHVAVITGIGEGLKLDFLEWDSPEKRSLVYRGVGDVVLPEGAVVMPAGEPLGHVVAKHSPGTLILFAADAHDPALHAHVAEGGKGVFLRDGSIVLSEGGKETVIRWKSTAEQRLVALPAAAAAWALHVPADQIAAALG